MDLSNDDLVKTRFSDLWLFSCHHRSDNILNCADGLNTELFHQHADHCLLLIPENISILRLINAAVAQGWRLSNSWMVVSESIFTMIE